MFFYLSFLRPPPRSASVTAKGLLITPQIANDLRTETFEDEVDVWFRWQSSDGRNSPHKKLTTWKGSQSLYKSIDVPLPSPLRVGDSWRLALWVSNEPEISSLNRDPLTIELLPSNSTQGEPGSLTAAEFGREVLPVISNPILIEGPRKNSKDGGRKSERVLRKYGLPPLAGGVVNDDSTEQRMRSVSLIEQTSFDLDKKVWDSGLGLSAWLAGLLNDSKPSNAMSMDLRTLLCSPGGFRAIELGTGIGVVSILLTALLEPWEATPARHILATDLGKIYQV
ncbi:hypothetical protein FRB94_011142 [Tulasnella sp. JGI-2019a]|nr:hypothetical protein FRB94_011142 [Tulasnella sp. JGI-2019a]KAG9029549.1 hypothetical protein FRB95_005223 [Tulasnella sp. JGI-2019a]